MYYFKVLFILINVINYCSGCLRNTAAAVGPTVTTGSMFTTPTAPTTTTCAPLVQCALPTAGAGAALSTPIYDSTTCEYTVIGSCPTPPRDALVVNADPTSTPSNPQTFICDSSSSNFYYIDATLGKTDALTLDCDCPVNSCGNPDTNANVDVTGPTVDANCVYTVDLNCLNPALPNLRFNPDSPEFLPPIQTLTCMAGDYYFNGMGGPTVLDTVRCA